jgi:hypothetical protein
VKRVLVTVLTISLAGCSFATVDRVGNPPPGPTPPSCTESPRPAQIDAALSLGLFLTMLGTLAAWGISEPDKDDNGNYKLGYYGIGIVGGSFGGLGFAVSAIYGKYTTANCRRVRGEWNRPRY